MLVGDLSIGELADACGLSRRAVRFYVQQQLLPPPNGRGRGRHYGPEHVERLGRIGQLQAAGHSLEAIRRIFEGHAVESPARPAARMMKTGLSAALWMRVKLMDGVELHLDASRHQPTVEQLLALRDAAQQLFGSEAGE